MPVYEAEINGQIFEIDAKDENELASAINSMTAAPQGQEYSPTAGMTGMEKFLAGAGGAMTSRLMGLGQLAGMVSPEQIAEQQRLAEPLMRETPAKVGSMVGDIAALAPTAFIPGAATLPGAMAIGAGTEALTTPGGLGERAQAGALGGALSGVGQLGARAIAGGMQGLGGLVEPFTPSGRENIAARTMQRFATDPEAALSALQNVPEYVPGSIPTTAEATGDIGLAQLQLPHQHVVARHRQIALGLEQLALAVELHLFGLDIWYHIIAHIVLDEELPHFIL